MAILAGAIAGEMTVDRLKEAEFPRTWDVLRAGVTEKVASGMVAGIWNSRIPDRVQLAHTGLRREIPGPLPMEADTIFDLASVSKVFGTATLAAIMVERRWISWDTELQALLPGYPYSGIRLRHLLSHTSGLPAWAPFWELLRERCRELFPGHEVHEIPVPARQKLMRELVFAIPPDVGPETRVLYSDLSFLLLGFALEELTRMPLDQAVSRFVWQPMGITDAFYNRTRQSAAKAVIEQVAATEDCPWRGAVLQGQVHDDNCWAMGGYAGHAGAFGTAKDVLIFARALLSGFVSANTLEQFWRPVALPAGCERTLGWDTPSGAVPAVGRFFSARTVGHLGFTGTSLWIDRDAGLAVVLLTNRVHPTRENDRIKAFRPRFHDALRADLHDLAR